MFYSTVYNHKVILVDVKNICQTCQHGQGIKVASTEDFTLQWLK